jgi:lysozyme family protein
MKGKILLLLLVLKTIVICANTKRFDLAYLETMKLEGKGYTAYHYDNDGGGTKAGITYKRFKQIVTAEKNWRRFDTDGDGKITKNDHRKMTMQLIKEVYKKHYWDKVNGDILESELVARLMYDYLVNGGFNIRKFQKLVGVRQDGLFGMQTVMAINKFDECKLSKSILSDRGTWLLKVMPRTRPATYRACKNGWKNRLNYFVSSFKKECKNEKLNFFTA